MGHGGDRGRALAGVGPPFGAEDLVVVADLGAAAVVALRIIGLGRAETQAYAEHHQEAEGSYGFHGCTPIVIKKDVD